MGNLKPTIYMQELIHRCDENEEFLVKGILEGPEGEVSILWVVEDENGVEVAGIDFCPMCALRLPDTLLRAFE